jgi:hypothetical protein
LYPFLQGDDEGDSDDDLPDLEADVSAPAAAGDQ